MSARVTALSMCLPVLALVGCSSVSPVPYVGHQAASSTSPAEAAKADGDTKPTDGPALLRELAKTAHEVVEARSAKVAKALTEELENYWKPVESYVKSTDPAAYRAIEGDMDAIAKGESAANAADDLGRTVEHYLTEHGSPAEAKDKEKDAKDGESEEAEASEATEEKAEAGESEAAEAPEQEEKAEPKEEEKSKWRADQPSYKLGGGITFSPPMWD